MKFDISDPKNQRILAILLVPVVIFTLFYNFIIKTKINELNTTKSEVVTIRNRVNDIKTKLGNPEELNIEKEILEAKLQDLEQILPNKENLSLLLDQLNTVENDSKVYMVGFEATETIDDATKPYITNKYKITIESGFHQFALFMSYVMTLPRILSFSELNISPTPTTGQGAIQEGLEDQPRYLTIECSLTSYVFKGFNGVP